MESCQCCQAAALAEKVAAFRHPKLSAVRLAGELNRKPMDGATLDELLGRIKTELTKLGPILDVEMVREPEGREPRAAWRWRIEAAVSDWVIAFRIIGAG